VSGNISFKDVDFHLLRLFDDRNDNIRKELLIVCNENEQCVDKRLSQIQQYRQLGFYSRGAKTMKKIKEMFGLSGDFSPVETLAGLVSSFK